MVSSRHLKRTALSSEKIHVHFRDSCPVPNLIDNGLISVSTVFWKAFLSEDSTFEVCQSLSSEGSEAEASLPPFFPSRCFSYC